MAGLKNAPASDLTASHDRATGMLLLRDSSARDGSVAPCRGWPVMGLTVARWLTEKRSRHARLGFCGVAWTI
jgi:hypothetical protein